MRPFRWNRFQQGELLWNLHVKTFGTLNYVRRESLERVTPQLKDEGMGKLRDES
jgi:hypothetical protein